MPSSARESPRVLRRDDAAVGQHHEMGVVNRHQRAEEERLGVLEVLVEDEPDVLGRKPHQRWARFGRRAGATGFRARSTVTASESRSRWAGRAAIASSRASAISMAENTLPISCASSPSAEISRRGTFGTIARHDATDRLEQQLAGMAQSAAEDDELGIEDRHDVGDRRAEEHGELLDHRRASASPSLAAS